MILMKILMKFKNKIRIALDRYLYDNRQQKVHFINMKHSVLLALYCADKYR